MAQPKSISANSLYQSKFLPIIEEAGTRIKLLILTAFLTMQPKYLLMYSIIAIIKSVDKKISKDINNREAYINGLYITSQNWIKAFYDKPKIKYYETKLQVENLVEGKAPKLDTPAKLNEYINKNRTQLNIWAEAKGTPYITNYDKEIEKRIKLLSENPLLTSEPGKKSISLWQKAELDVRYEHQKEMLYELIDKGVEYAYISSHPNCSKRCESFQGELVSLTKRAISPQQQVRNYRYNKSSFVVDVINSKSVYSLTDIMNCVDEYGYQNNIICGFNCRHRLIEYKGQHAPTDYDKTDIEKQRKIENKIRSIERKIRAMKQEYELLVKDYQLTKSSSIKQQAQLLKIRIDKMTEYYKSFCESNGYAYELYRIKVR